MTFKALKLSLLVACFAPTSGIYATSDLDSGSPKISAPQTGEGVVIEHDGGDWHDHETLAVGAIDTGSSGNKEFNGVVHNEEGGVTTSAAGTLHGDADGNVKSAEGGVYDIGADGKPTVAEGTVTVPSTATGKVELQGSYSEGSQPTVTGKIEMTPTEAEEAVGTLTGDTPSAGDVM